MAVKVFVRYLPPVAGASLRYLIASIILGFITLLTLKRYSQPTLREIGGAVATGILFLCLGTGLLTVAAPNIAASISALIFATVPSWLVLFAFQANQKLDRRFAAAGAVGVSGVAVILGNEIIRSSSTASLVGLSLATIATLFWALASFRFNSIGLPKNGTLSLLIQTTSAALVLAILALGMGEIGTMTLGAVPLVGWMALLFASVFGSIIAYGSLQRLLRRHSPEVASTYTFVNPIVAALGGALLLGERLSLITFVGGTMIVSVACYLALTGAGREGTRESQPR